MSRFSIFFCKENSSFNENFSLSIDFKDISENLMNLCNEEFYVFNDVIYSRSFVKPFLIRALYNFINNFNQSYKLIQVGGKNEIDEVKIDKNKKIVNLRGEINISELFFLISNPNCKGYIGFDNAIMHIALFLRKKAFVKFRGRFFKK